MSTENRQQWRRCNYDEITWHGINMWHFGHHGLIVESSNYRRLLVADLRGGAAVIGYMYKLDKTEFWSSFKKIGSLILILLNI